MATPPMTRREWLAQTSAAAPARARVAPREELVNTLEFETEAAKVLDAVTARLIAGGDRAAFDRITFRPRMMIPCMDLDLSVELFGTKLFAPIIVGPVADQKRFHAEGEVATVRGATAAKAAMVMSSRASIAAKDASTSLFYQVFAEEGARAITSKAKDAEQAGGKAVFVTVGATDAASAKRAARIDWAAADAVRAAVSIPVVVKGVTSAQVASEAAQRGFAGVVVSTYGRPEAPGQPAPVDLVASVADAVGSKVPVLVDGGFRRGTDIMKALAFGARAVLVARPVMWGLAAYGADGVQSVLELLQTDLARVMACCGAPNLGAITKAMVKVHRA